jgi:hypothetical protein
MKCKHEGKVRWMLTGELSKSESQYGVRKRLTKKVPVLHCDKCDKEFIISIKEKGDDI